MISVVILGWIIQISRYKTAKLWFIKVKLAASFPSFQAVSDSFINVKGSQKMLLWYGTSSFPWYNFSHNWNVEKLFHSTCLKLRNLTTIFYYQKLKQIFRFIYVYKFSFLYKICFVFEIVFFCFYDAISVKANSEK